MANKINLLPDEQVVRESPQGILTLTTKRVRYDSTYFGGSRFVSITLDSVASCGLVTKSFPILLLLSAAAFFGGYTYTGHDDTRSILYGIGAFLVVLYFLTRRGYISIASNGGQRIQMPSSNMTRDYTIEFFDALEREKLK